MLLFMQVGIPVGYPLENGRPTSKGIELYVEQTSDYLVKEYQDFVEDTIYNVWIYADELQDRWASDSIELGRYFPHEIYVTTAELYEAYELDDLPAEEREKIFESNKFVKAVMIHELTHEYVNQVGVEMQSVLRMHVDKSYRTGLWIVNSHETFGSVFIEEGICEYLCAKMGELIPPKHLEAPQTVEELLDRDRDYLIKYKYSSAFLETFLDTTGFKRGIQILLFNPPPTYEEILQPDRFFSRLELPEFKEASSDIR
jgi:hypothetical protein